MEKPGNTAWLSHMISGTGELREWVAGAVLTLVVPASATRVHAAFAAGLAGFFTAPLVRNALLVCSPSAFAGDLALTLGRHGREATVGPLAFRVGSAFSLTLGLFTGKSVFC
jgi:hypothetical protein